MMLNMIVIPVIVVEIVMIWIGNVFMDLLFCLLLINFKFILNFFAEFNI